MPHPSSASRLATAQRLLLIVAIAGCGRSQPEPAPDATPPAKSATTVRPAVPETQQQLAAQGKIPPTVPTTAAIARAWPGHFNGRLETVVSAAAGVHALAVSPDGRFMAVARQLGQSSGSLQVWDVESSLVRQELFEPWGITAVAFAPDSNNFAYGAGDRSLVLQPMAGGKTSRWNGHRLSIRDLAFSPDGKRLASVGNDKRVIVWDVARGTALAETIDDNPRFASRVYFPSPDRLWSWNGNDRVCWFGVQPSSLTPGEVLTLAERMSPMTTDGHKLYGLRSDRSLHVVDAATARDLPAPPIESSVSPVPESLAPPVIGNAMAIAVARKSHDIAISTTDGRLTLWKGGDLKAKQSWDIPGAQVTLLATDDEGRIWAGLTAGGGLLVLNRDQPEAPRWLEREPVRRGPPIASRISAQGTTVVSAIDSKTLVLSQIDDGRTRQRFVRNEAAESDVPTALFAGRDDIVLCGTSTGSVEFWKSDVPTLSSYSVSKSSITALAESPEGQVVLAGDEDGITTWLSLHQSEEPVRRREHTAPIRAAAVSPDGRRAATASDDRTIVLWDVASQSKIATLKGHHDSVQAVMFSPDGLRLVSGDQRGTVILWELSSGEQAWSTTLPEALVQTQQRPAAASMKTLVSAIPQLVFGPWTTNNAPSPERKVGSGITALAFDSADRVLAVGTATGYTRTFDLARRLPLSEMYYQTPVSDLAFAKDRASLLVATPPGGVFRCWQTPEIPIVLSGHRGSVRFTALDAAGRRAVTGGEDRRLGIWDVDQGTLLQSLENEGEVIVSGALSPDGSRAVTGGYGAGVVFWDLASMKRLAKVYGHGKRVQSLAVSADGKWVASGSDDQTVRIWDFSTRKTKRMIPHDAPVHFVTFSPDGAKLLTSTLSPLGWQFPSRLRLWDPATGKLISELKGHRAAVNTAVFSADGLELTSCGADGQTCRWTIATGQPIHDSFRADGLSHAGLINGGRQLVVRRFNNGVVIYDLATMERLSEFDVPTRYLGDLGVASQGNRIIAGTEEGVVYVWSISHE